MKHTKIYLPLIIAAILIFGNKGFGQCVNHIMGNYILQSSYFKGKVFAKLDTCCNGGNTYFMVDTGSTRYAQGWVWDTVTCTLGYDPLARFWNPRGNPDVGCVSKVTVSVNYDTIIAQYWVDNALLPQDTLLGPDTDIYIRTATGIENIINEIKIKSWPNPVTNNLYYTINCTEPEVSVRLFNIMGDCIYQSIIKVSQYKTEQIINMQPYAAGMYFLQISSGEYVSSNKVIKQ